MAISFDEAFAFIANILLNDTTFMGLVPGGIIVDLADPGTATPFGIMSRMGGTDVNSATADRIFSDDTYQIKVVGPREQYDAGISPGYARADVLLQKTSSYQTGGKILGCYRLEPFHTTEIVNGKPWENSGGLYRIEIQA